MKKTVIKLLALSAFSVLFFACQNNSSDSSSSSSNTDSTVVETIAYNPTQLNSCIEYIYDAENFTDYKEIDHFTTDGLTKDVVELFFYNKEEIASSSLETKLKEQLKATMDILPAYNKNTRSGAYVSVMCKVENLTLKPAEQSVYYVTQDASGTRQPFESMISKTYDINEDGYTLSNSVCNFSYQGYAEITGNKITYSKNNSSKKLFCISFNPSNSGSVSYYALVDYTNGVVRGGEAFPTEEVEYYTQNLKCTFTETAEGTLELTLNNENPPFSYKNKIPAEAIDYVNNKWYQVNRTVNFFNSKDGSLTATEYFLYKMTWDESLFKNFFVLQTEYNTDSTFSEASVTNRVKTVNLIPLTSELRRSVIFIYGETIQNKNVYSYEVAPVIANFNGSGKQYVSQVSTYRKSKNSTDLELIRNKKSDLFLVDGVLHETHNEYVTAQYKTEVETNTQAIEANNNRCIFKL